MILEMGKSNREDQIFLKDGVSNVKSRQEISKSLVNILVHQWFSKPVIEPSLLDGIATYLEYKILSELEPMWLISDLFYVEVLQEAFLDDCGSTLVANVHVHSSLFYKKVAAILHMMGTMTSEDIIRNGLKDLAKNRNIISTNQFLAAFHQSYFDENHPPPAPWTFTEVLRVWLSQPSYPIVTVDMNQSLITIAQKDASLSGCDWPILLTYTAQKDSVFNKSTFNSAWLLPGQSQLTLHINNSEEAWVLFNINQSGYYRVNYGAKNWQLLTNQLMSNHSEIPVLARSQIVDDAFQLAWSEKLDYEVVLNLIQYLHEEHELLPLTSASRNFEQLIRHFYGTALSSHLQELVRDLYSKFYNLVYRKFSMVEDHVTEIERMEVLHWACHWQLDSCLDFTATLFKQWQSSSFGFPPEYKPSALCRGVRLFPEVFFDVFDSFTEATVESDRQVFLFALACTNSSQHLQFLLENAFTNKNQMMFGHNDIILVFNYIAQTPEHIKNIIDFLGKNYNIMSSRLGEKTMDSIWTSLIENIRLESDIELVESLMWNSTEDGNLKERLNLLLANLKKTLHHSKRLEQLVLTAFHLTGSTQKTPVSSPMAEASSACIHYINLITFLTVSVAFMAVSEDLQHIQ